MPYPRRYAKGRQPTKGEMNKLERRYSEQLEAWRLTGEIQWWKYDAIKLRLADNTFYTPDFLVMKADSTLEVHETKGHWEDDARVKIKVAAEAYPLFRFVAVQLVKGEWVTEDF